LVQLVLSAVGNGLVQPGHLLTRLVPTPRALFLAREGFLSLKQFFPRLLEVPGVVDQLST